MILCGVKAVSWSSRVPMLRVNSSCAVQTFGVCAAADPPINRRKMDSLKVRIARYHALYGKGDQPMKIFDANTLKRVLRWLGMLFGPGGGTLDPFANRPAPVVPKPKSRSGAVAVAEPDDD